VVAHLLTRRLEALAAQALAGQGAATARLDVPRGHDEVARIGAILATAVDRLQAEKAALVRLNAELDERVAQRTARIERMAEEARHAAVGRERLRLARDLHDTLAHSLMALLTQIRLVRKLRTRLAPAELDAELASAEQVAATGLADARGAIAQIRHNGVRDAGLGPALAGLVRRFGQRSGVEVRLDVDPGAAELAGERAETAFRIVEEALRNVERHARAGSVQVQVAAEVAQASEASGGSTQVTVAVSDDGVGFDPAAPAPGHYGLRGAAEQAALIEATLTLDSRPGAGTRLELRFEA